MGGELKYICFAGPVSKPGLYIGHNSVIKGYVKLGNNVRIGNGTHIISEKSRVFLEDSVDIGDCNTIKEADHLKKNKDLDVIIGAGTRTKSNVVIENGVVIGRGNYIGTGVIIGRNIIIGDGNRFNQGANIAKNTKIGSRNTFYHCTIGSAPQGQFHEDDGTEVIIGNDNLFREYLVLNRGSKKGGGKTIVGDKNKIYSQCHIAHDCIIGDDNELISGTFLAGHVTVEDHVRIAGLGGIGQFLKVGSYSFIQAAAKVLGNVLPYSRVDGSPARFRGINFNRIEWRYKDNPEKAKQVLEQVQEAYKIVKDKSISDSDLDARLRELKTIPSSEIADFISLIAGTDKHLLRFRK